jgi:predicted nucleic acid-binding protein
MTADTFIDTNVLLYSVPTSEDEVDKRATAWRVLTGSGWGLSVQVLQEFYVNGVRPPRRAMTPNSIIWSGAPRRPWTGRAGCWWP